MLLIEFEIRYVAHKSVKWQIVVDYIAENPTDGYKPIVDFFPYY